MLVVCENTDHEFFTELNEANQLGLIRQNPANILEDVGIAVTHLYDDEDSTFPKEVYIDLDPAGRAEVRMEALFQLSNLGTTPNKVVLSYQFKGVEFDGNLYECEFNEEIAEIMLMLQKSKL